MSSSLCICGVCKSGSREIDFETRCSHLFHKKCLEKTISTKNATCPVCEEEISFSQTFEGLKRGDTTLTEREKCFITDCLCESDPKLLGYLAVYYESADVWDEFLKSKPIYDPCEKKIIKATLEMLSDSSEKDSDEHLSMLYACSFEKRDALDSLIDLGRKTEPLKKSDSLLFCLACKYGYISIVKVLLEMGVDANTVEGIKTALTFACKGDQLDVAKLLVKYGSGVESKYDDTITPLIAATKNGNIEMMTWLLKCGADIDSTDFYSIPALSHASKKGHIAAFEFLIAQGASYTPSDKYRVNQFFLSICDSKNLSVFNRIMDLGHLSNGEILWYICDWYEEDSEGLLEQAVKAGTDVNFKDLIGNSILHNACMYQRVKNIDALISLGADVNCRNINLETPLFFLCKVLSQNYFPRISKDPELYKNYIAKFIQILKRLLEAGIDINARNQYGQTALFYAVNQNQNGILRVLVNYGADVNVVALNGDNLMHKACENGNWWMLKKLLRLKCNHINSKNIAGFAPIHILCDSYSPKSDMSYLKCLNVLIKNGADIHCENNSGNITPLRFCIKEGHKDMIKRLEDLGAIR